jgi:cold shock CspA family protein
MVGKMYSSAFSTVERAGKGNLNEGPKVSYDVVSERGKLAVASQQAV